MLQETAVHLLLKDTQLPEAACSGELKGLVTKSRLQLHHAAVAESPEIRHEQTSCVSLDAR